MTGFFSCQITGKIPIQSLWVISIFFTFDCNVEEINYINRETFSTMIHHSDNTQQPWGTGRDIYSRQKTGKSRHLWLCYFQLRFGGLFPSQTKIFRSPLGAAHQKAKAGEVTDDNSARNAKRASEEFGLEVMGLRVQYRILPGRTGHLFVTGKDPVTEPQMTGLSRQLTDKFYLESLWVVPVLHIRSQQEDLKFRIRNLLNQNIVVLYS